MQKCKQHRKYGKYDCPLCEQALQALIRKLVR